MINEVAVALGDGKDVPMESRTVDDGRIEAAGEPFQVDWDVPAVEMMNGPSGLSVDEELPLVTVRRLWGDQRGRTGDGELASMRLRTNSFASLTFIPCPSLDWLIVASGLHLGKVYVRNRPEFQFLAT